MVLIEARVLRRDDSVLKIERNLGQRNEFVALVIRGAVNPRLEATLDVHCSCGWVDPPRGQQDQGGK
jgi:hypothetical protein